MSRRVIWAFRPLPELEYKTGLLEVDETLGNKLIASGDAQDPAIGGNHLKYIETTAPKAVKGYKTRQLKARENTDDARED